LAVCAALALAALAWAEDLDGPAIVKKMAKANESQSSIAKAKMTIVDKNGAQRVRDLKLYTKLINGVRNAVTVFLSPPDVRGVKFLVIENKTGGDDDQRIYLPEQKRVRRITTSNKSSAFMGSTFAYADLQTPNAEKGKHKRLDDAKMAGFDCYVIESTPKKEDDYIYSRLIYWVRKDNFLPVRADFYDKKGQPWKVMEVGEHLQRADGTWYAKSTKMTNVQDRSSTTLDSGEQQINVPVADDVFTERFLSDESAE
jgi:outer membrane lipoprotein-sorting protein